MTYKGCGKKEWGGCPNLRICGKENHLCPSCSKQKCENCGKEINVSETALKLCDGCFDEKCECGHIRAKHIDNNGSCIHEFSIQHKTKRGEFCPCKKFILEEKKQ